MIAGLAVAAVLLGGSAIVVGSGLLAGPSASPTASTAAAASPSPRSSLPISSPSSPSPSPEPSPTQPVAGTDPFPLAAVVGITDKRVSITADRVGTAIDGGGAILPCGLERIDVGGEPIDLAGRPCVEPGEVIAAVGSTADSIGLLPVGLVDPRVKALEIDGADLFGAADARAAAYPVLGRAPEYPLAWVTYAPDEVRTVVMTGDTCPDRGVSLRAVVQKKGWDWTLGGGTARYTGVYRDTRFSGLDGKGWPVVRIATTGNAGAVKALMTEADLTLNDFECPMIEGFRQHNSGTVFSIDPRVADLLARHGVDVVTLGSNHIGDQGTSGVTQTLDLFEAAGVKTVGAGRDLAEAIEPAIVDVRGLTFGIVGFDATGVSRSATASRPGVFQYAAKTVEASMAAATEAADVVIVMPQWGFPEYHAEWTSGQLKQMAYLYGLGADIILGEGTHWASAVQLEAGGDTGYRFSSSSTGNFLFHQDWSRQTMEGVIPELAFVGDRLVRVRLHPYVIYDWGQPNLTDPTTDGAFVLDQIWGDSVLP